MNIWQDFHGPNAGYVLELYERYRSDPASVDAATRAYFDQWTPPPTTPTTPPTPAIDKIVDVVNLAQAIREYGHLQAQLDPLGSPPPDDQALGLAAYGLTEEDLAQLPVSLIGGPLVERLSNALEAIQALRLVYSATTGYDYEHVRVTEEREWLRHMAESSQFRPPQDPINPQALLERLTRVEVFEHFLHRTFPGKTRFSIEGLDMLVPILDELVGAAAEADIGTVLIGMAHRGRLNVMTHVLNKPYAQILAEFKDPVGDNDTTRTELGWTGDVKYHKGARRAIKDGEMVELVVTLAPNPSHLEHINPVIIGMAKAAGTQVDQAGSPHFDPSVTLPIIIHGDTSFPGQGIVAETLNFSRLPGYSPGGTIHIIANNQLGFTTEPTAGRSTLYASDLAKGFKIPIVHVNADDPEACIEAARLAFAYTSQFEKDFLIDLVGYRRYGHNEGDEPRFTQPLLYQKIEAHPTVRQLWADILLERGLIEPSHPEALVNQQTQELQAIFEALQPKEEILEPQLEPPPAGAARRVPTAVPAERLRALNQALLQKPDSFTRHPKLERALERRQIALDPLDEPTIDWALAEELAFASILEEGIAIRLTGEDVERGTFSHRHAVWYDAQNGQPFIPLQALPQAKAAFEVRNSPLSENAAIGIEYGYNIQAPDRLVIWEAQYGDFINAAQAIIDEFVVSGRAKWEQTPSLVLLLPHGYEGQGPDHSTGRLERFLQSAAETNIRIANCTAAAQYFHLLRRQAALLKTDPLPLIVMTPKSLLRHRLAASTPHELAEGRWQRVIDDTQARRQAKQVQRLILCSGKIFVDLVSSERRETSPAIAIVRVEQLYPFPTDDLQQVLESYPNLAEILWVQEEPKNMGAWSYAQVWLEEIVKGRWPLRYLGRPASSSPAEGSAAWHAVNQKALVEQAYNLESSLVKADAILLEQT